MRKITLLLLMIATTSISNAQTITTVGSGLWSPAGICKDMNGNLFVAEAGTGTNNGRVSMFDTTGMRWTIVAGLPSHMDTATGEVSGPWRPYMMADSMLMVITGGGPDTLGGVDSVAGSILLFDLTTFVPGPDSLDVTDAVKIIDIQSWVYSNGFVDSNPFSMLFDSASGNMYVADAGANAILMIDSAANISVLDTFPPIPNPGPFPPVIEYVPTDVVADQMGNLQMCNLTGFPFVPGLANVVTVDTAGFSHTTFATGLTLCVDMEMDSVLYVLQYGLFDTATFMPIPGSASIVSVSATGVVDTVVTGFGVSAGFTTDWTNGFYATEIMSGSLIHITDINTSVPAIQNPIAEFSAYPNPFSKEIHLNYTLAHKSNLTVTLTDQLGKTLYRKNVGTVNHGNHSLEITSKDIDLNILSAGKYFVTISDGTSKQSLIVIKE